MPTTQHIIQQYYDSFNRKDMPTFLSLLHEDVIHDINQGGTEIGKAAFARFMDDMKRCFDETISDLIIFTHDSEQHAAAKFVVDGVYLETYAGHPRANKQQYHLNCGAFFELANGKITRVTVYDNTNEWLKQINL